MNVIPLYVLEEATDNFAEDRCIGEGGYGKVYKTEGVDGTLWAVKRSKLISDNSVMDFVLEVKATARTRDLKNDIIFCHENENELTCGQTILGAQKFGKWFILNLCLKERPGK